MKPEVPSYIGSGGMPHRGGATLHEGGVISTIPVRTPDEAAANGHGAISSHETHAAKVVLHGAGKETITRPVHTYVENAPGSQYETHGMVRESGVVVTKDGQVVAAVRSPRWIPEDIEADEIVWGGEPAVDMIEQSYLRPMGQFSIDIARILIDDAQESPILSLAASYRGSEVESILTRVHGSKAGEIVAAPQEEQEELQTGVWEKALDPVETLEEGTLLRAQHAIDAINRWGSEGILPVNTSVPISGEITPDGEGGFTKDPGLKINQGAYKGYVRGMSNRLRRLIGRHDEYAGQAGDHLAKMHGKDTLEALVEQTDDITFWVSTAAHQSVSLPHIQNEQGKYVVPAELAIAVADMENSNMAKVAGLLMYSSPLLLSEMPEIQTPNGAREPRDWRDLLRRVMATSIPGEMVKTVEELNKRTEQGIVDGDTHTIDRTAYRAKLQDGTDTPSYHGPVRIRMARPENPKSTIGRIEVTEAGNSFSLLDFHAFTTMVDILKLGALEAAAHGMHPADYFGDKYPMVKDSSKRIAIGDGYNLNGPDDPTAREAITQTLAFMDEMAEKYPPQEKNIRFAQARIKNLLVKTTIRDFDDYMKDPTGQVTEVMRNMQKDGNTPAQIAEAITKYEYELAHKIVEVKGDVTQLYDMAA